MPMTSTQQFDELKRRIWQIANDVRGTVDGWDFKQYVLGALFYRFISENFARYIEGGDDSIHYAKLGDDIITSEIKDDAIKEIMRLFDQKEDAPHIAQSVRMEKIAEDEYNLSVSSYVEAKDTREVINITELNKEIATTVRKIDRLRSDIDKIVAEIEGSVA